MPKKLFTFGCSWTYGIGAGYEPGMPEKEYNNIFDNLQLADEYSWRRYVKEHYQLENENFSLGGSSNDLQFRLASQHFMVANSDVDYTGSICIWGITSIYRKEWYDVKNKCYNNVMFSNDPKHNPAIAREYVLNHLEPTIEFKKLATKMQLWNAYFKSRGIINYWFDTFNSHNYGIPNDRMIFNGRDMLTLMTENTDTEYHKSRWYDKIDKRASIGIKKGLLNPISRHPTKEGYKDIARLVLDGIQRIEGGQ